VYSIVEPKKGKGKWIGQIKNQDVVKKYGEESMLISVKTKPSTWKVESGIVEFTLHHKGLKDVSQVR